MSRVVFGVAGLLPSTHSNASVAKNCPRREAGCAQGLEIVRANTDFLTWHHNVCSSVCILGIKSESDLYFQASLSL